MSLPMSKGLLALAAALSLAFAGCGSSEKTASSPAPAAKEAFNGVDVRFTQGMLPHHMQAVRNAKIEIAMGKAPEVKAIAEKILAEQEKEIATMQGFLKTFGAQEKAAPADQQAV
ncbi:MAG: DUF305 domain-containing protein, partial [Thermoleophilaceae bacterium]